MFEAQLKDVPFFSGLSKRELATVAQLTDEVDVEAGAVLARQGDFGQEFFVIIDGTAEVLRGDEPIAELGPGEFFGEMALISGEARSATVVAKTDVECYRLDRASFQELLAAQPGIAAEVARIMGTRKSDLDQARDAFARLPEPVVEKKIPLFTRLRRFFFGQPA
jgi:CRP-like cAMP-binding protein